MKLIDFFNTIRPAELARLRGRRQDTSSRDKKRLLSLVEEIEAIAEKKGVKIKIENEKYFKQ